MNKHVNRGVCFPQTLLKGDSVLAMACVARIYRRVEFPAQIFVRFRVGYLNMRAIFYFLYKIEPTKFDDESLPYFIQNDFTANQNGCYTNDENVFCYFNRIMMVI